MNREGIHSFLLAIGVKEESIVDNDEWVACPCPLASALHEGGTDERPSFGVSIDDNGPSFYHCFTCSHTMYPLAGLCYDMWLIHGVYPYDALALVVNNDNEVYRYDSKPFDPRYVFDSQERDSECRPLPKRVLKAYPLLMRSSGGEARLCRDYLHKRGIPDEAIEASGVRYCEDREALVFPFTDRAGDIYSLRMRLRKIKKTWTVNEKIAGEDCGKIYKRGRFAKRTQVGYWFGLHLMNWDLPVTLVEGEIDRMRLWALGKPNTMASGGVGITKRQLSEVMSLQVLLGLDADKAGIGAISRLRRLLNDRSLYQLNWALAKNSNGDGRCKDGGDLPNEKALLFVYANMRRLS